MNIRKMAFTALILGLCSQAQAYQAKVVYGDDNRKDIFEVTNQLHLDVATSTAAMIYDYKMTARDGGFVIEGGTLESKGICSDEKFAEQQTGANCSGFLVGEDLLVTAGHCMKTMSNCNNAKWVFDFAVTEEGQSEHFVGPESVYSCVEIIEQELNRSTQDDYALIRLDRKVTNRTPLAFRTEGKIEDGAEIFVIGHPTGLPTKVADDSYVRGNNRSTYFSANLDTFGGNSGSAVFNADTGVVEGILVRGASDYVYDYENGCRRPNVCTMQSCRGEDVTRITNIKSL